MKNIIVLLVLAMSGSAIATVKTIQPLPYAQYKIPQTMDMRYTKCGVIADFYTDLSKATTNRTGIDDPIQNLLAALARVPTPLQLETIVTTAEKIYNDTSMSAKRREQIIEEGYRECIRVKPDV